MSKIKPKKHPSTQHLKYIRRIITINKIIIKTTKICNKQNKYNKKNKYNSLMKDNKEVNYKQNNNQ